MTERIFVTGSTSCLGRAVVANLLARGNEVTCFQRSAEGPTTTVVGDICDAEAVNVAARHHDGIIHLAALVAPKPLWSRAVSVNVDGAVTVAKAARSSGRLVHISSPSVAFTGVGAIGAPAGPPNYSGRDVYTQTKALGERAILEVEGVTTIVVRPHLIYGPGDEQLIGRLIDRSRRGRLVLPSHGSALIDTTYVDDAASAIVAAFDRTSDTPELAGSCFVVSGGEPRPVVEIVTEILKAFDLVPKISSVPKWLAHGVGATFDRFWQGAEPPLTTFAAEQLSVAHSFDLRSSSALLRWAPTWSVEAAMSALRNFAQSEAGQQFLDRRRNR